MSLHKMLDTRILKKKRKKKRGEESTHLFNIDIGIII
jgi:hypothetical protein